MKPICTMQCSIKKVISMLNGYYYAKINILNYQNGTEIPHSKNVIIEGPFLRLYAEAEYELEGYWNQISPTKETFVVTKSTELLTSSDATVFKYMKDILKGKHYQDKIIKLWISEFGINIIQLIKDNDPSLLIRMTQSRLDELCKLFTTAQECEEAFYYMTNQNILSEDALKIISRYGSNTLMKIKLNPYIMLTSNMDFGTIDSIAMFERIAYNDENRIDGAIRAYIRMKVVSNGDLFVTKDEFFSANSPFMNFVFSRGSFDDILSDLEIKTVMDKMIARNKLIVEVVDGQTCVYLDYFYKMENFVVNKLKEFQSAIATKSVYMTDLEIDKELSSNTTIDPTQKQAVITGLQRRFSVITGGPGTGKTQTIKAIVDALLHKNPSATINLCAPTGKASKRMTEVIGLPAQTIHRKLKYGPQYSEAEDELEEIICDLLIVDEASMIDINLFYVLLSNISENTNIIMVGDHNQIPSVGPGLILRDIIDSGVLPVTKLTKIFRQKNFSGIIEASNAILNGNAETIIEKPNMGDFKYIQENNKENIIEKMKDMVIKAKGKINKSNFQILTTTNDGLFGTLGLNKVFQEILNPKDVSKQEVYISATKIFREGDKVIHITNNYDLQVFNGSVGVILKILPKRNLAIIEFDDEEVEYSFKDMSELMLAYAITIHKSQGSEFEYVMMPIVQSCVNNMNIYYTAVTRAKKQMIMIGSPQILTSVVGVNGKKSLITTGLERKSNVKTKLQKS